VYSGRQVVVIQPATRSTEAVVACPVHEVCKTQGIVPLRCSFQASDRPVVFLTVRRASR
jgi:hypothetical protein